MICKARGAPFVCMRVGGRRDVCLRLYVVYLPYCGIKALGPPCSGSQAGRDVS